jgi:hypothetical protein
MPESSKIRSEVGEPAHFDTEQLDLLDALLDDALHPSVDDRDLHRTEDEHESVADPFCKVAHRPRRYLFEAH